MRRMGSPACRVSDRVFPVRVRPTEAGNTAIETRFVRASPGGRLRRMAVDVVRTRVIDDGQRVILRRARLVGADFSGRKLVEFASEGSRLERCRFDGTKIDYAVLGSGGRLSEYVGCTFDGARIRFGPAGTCRFVGCSFREVDLRDWFCFRVELVDCVFSGRLRKVVFNGRPVTSDRPSARRVRNEFRGNDFSQAELIDVSFRTGIDLTEQQLPTGPDYIYVANAEAALPRVRDEVTRWPDPEQRRLAMVLVNIIQEDLDRASDSSFCAATTTHAIRPTTPYSTSSASTAESCIGIA